MNEMISLQEILNIIDKKYAYSSDPDVERLLNNSDLDEKYKHLISRKDLNRLFNYYAQDQNKLDYTDLIRVEGGTKGTRYNSDDIMTFINYPSIKKRLENKVLKKTIKTPFGLAVPTCIYHEYIEEQVDDPDELNSIAIEKLTGYTKYQVDLFSVPSEILEKSKIEFEKEIEEIEKTLIKKQSQLNDIMNELHTRGLN